jgi:hypothetical protein
MSRMYMHPAKPVGILKRGDGSRGAILGAVLVELEL